MRNDSVHTMSLATLRVRANEVLRLIAEARVIARASFDAVGMGVHGPGSSREAADRVGSLLDAAQKLLPGMAPLAEAHDGAPRSKPPESSWRRVTMRGGEEHALERIERAKILEEIAEEAAILFAEIERGRSSAQFMAAEPSSTGDSERLPRRTS